MLEDIRRTRPKHDIRRAIDARRGDRFSRVPLYPGKRPSRRENVPFSEGKRTNTTLLFRRIIYYRFGHFTVGNPLNFFHFFTLRIRYIFGTRRKHTHTVPRVGFVVDEIEQFIMSSPESRIRFETVGRTLWQWRNLLFRTLPRGRTRTWTPGRD